MENINLYKLEVDDIILGYFTDEYLSKIVSGDKYYIKKFNTFLYEISKSLDNPSVYLLFEGYKYIPSNNLTSTNNFSMIASLFECYKFDLICGNGIMALSFEKVKINH